MRRKPSIFSKNYQKKIRRRKIRRIALTSLTILMVVLGITVFYNRVNFQGVMGFLDNDNSSVEADEGKNSDSKNNGEEEITKEVEGKESSVESYELTLENGDTIKITYKITDEGKNIQVVDSGFNIKCHVSPSQKQLLIFNEESKDIFILNENRELLKITNPKYVSTDNQIFTKESVLAFSPNYKWVNDASFIDENHVAYSSALPWINQEGTLYLWIVDLSTGMHKGYYNIKGKDFVFKEVTENGITVEVDGKVMIVNSDGILK